MIFDHYWKKRAMKAERELRSARGTAAAAKALREDQEDRFQQLNERDTYQAIAIETLQEENRNLRRQHRRDEDLVEELEKEIEEKEATLNTLRGVMQVMEENNRRLWERFGGDDLHISNAGPVSPISYGQSMTTAPTGENCVEVRA